MSLQWENRNDLAPANGPSQVDNARPPNVDEYEDVEDIDEEEEDYDQNGLLFIVLCVILVLIIGVCVFLFLLQNRSTRNEHPLRNGIDSVGNGMGAVGNAMAGVGREIVGPLTESAPSPEPEGAAHTASFRSNSDYSHPFRTNIDVHHTVTHHTEHHHHKNKDTTVVLKLRNEYSGSSERVEEPHEDFGHCAFINSWFFGKFEFSLLITPTHTAHSIEYLCEYSNPNLYLDLFTEAAADYKEKTAANEEEGESEGVVEGIPVDEGGSKGGENSSARRRLKGDEEDEKWEDGQKESGDTEDAEEHEDEAEEPKSVDSRMEKERQKRFVLSSDSNITFFDPENLGNPAKMIWLDMDWWSKIMLSDECDSTGTTRCRPNVEIGSEFVSFQRPCDILEMEGALVGVAEWVGGDNCNCFEGCSKSWQPLIEEPFAQQSMIMQDCTFQEVRATNFRWILVPTEGHSPEFGAKLEKVGHPEYFKKERHGKELAERWKAWIQSEGIPFWKCRFHKIADVSSYIEEWQEKQKVVRSRNKEKAAKLNRLRYFEEEAMAKQEKEREQRIRSKRRHRASGHESSVWVTTENGQPGITRVRHRQYSEPGEHTEDAESRRLAVAETNGERTDKDQGDLGPHSRSLDWNNYGLLIMTALATFCAVIQSFYWYFSG